MIVGLSLTDAERRSLFYSSVLFYSVLFYSILFYSSILMCS